MGVADRLSQATKSTKCILKLCAICGLVVLVEKS
jgi:hypothetical protein